MKWLLVAVAFLLGAAITWFLTVKRVTQTVSSEGADLGDVDQGGSGMGSSEAHCVEGLAGDGGSQADAHAGGSDDASRFGGQRTSAAASSRVGWDHDAEDIDALLSDEEKSGEETSGDTSGEEKTDEAKSGDA